MSRFTKWVLGCVVLSSLLAGCSSRDEGMIIPVPPPIVYIDGSTRAFIYNQVVILQAGVAQTPIPADATTAKFFIGSWESPLVDDGRIQYARFSVTVENTCRTLPQGDDLLARYELYDAAGTLVKQDETKILVETCPGGQP